MFLFVRVHVKTKAFPLVASRFPVDHFPNHAADQDKFLISKRF
jgi:hypothetical protein